MSAFTRRIAARSERTVLKQVAVYASENRTNAPRKEDAVFAELHRVLHAMSDVDCERRTLSHASVSSPGLLEIDMAEVTVAFGRAAHTALADHRKHTLVVGADDEDTLEEDLERLLWSCVNTSKIVALGRDAWRSAQMLPVDERRFYACPPLPLLSSRTAVQSKDLGREVLVIDHEPGSTRAREISEVLEREGYAVRRSERDPDRSSAEAEWCADAPIHVHVGFHDEGAEEIRLLDTWRSGRCAILLVPRRLAQTPPTGALMIDPEANGFLCDTPAKVLAACDDLHADPVLRRRLLLAGAGSVAPLVKNWLSIANELTA